MRYRRDLLLCGLLVIGSLSPANGYTVRAEEIVPGPIALEAAVAVDGDTVKGWVIPLPGQRQRLTIRIRGIDAPELNGACAAEIEAAQTARNWLAALLPNRKLFLLEIAPDKFYGRVVAQIVDTKGSDLGAELLKAGHARPYDGHGPRQGWCGKK